MSASEDYLDQLLSGMTDEEKKGQSSDSDEDFMQEFEKGLAENFDDETDTDGFLKGFDKDLGASDDDLLFSDGIDPL